MHASRPSRPRPTLCLLRRHLKYHSLPCLPAVEERVSIGTAEVKAVFGSGARKVAGCLVSEGSLRKGAVAVVKRGKRVVYEVGGSGSGGGGSGGGSGCC